LRRPRLINPFPPPNTRETLAWSLSS